MRRTPQYNLIFYELGDLYSAADDLDRMTTIDNQLQNLSRIVGEGILTGWSISLDSGLTIEVSPGFGFIDNVVHRTLTIKSGDIVDDAVNSVYLVSRFLGEPGGYRLETESPSSLGASATFVDITPPSVPTSFSGTSADFDLVNLFWDANSESDFDHYEIERDTVAGFTSPVAVGSPVSNGISPGTPFQDANLASETDYYYRIKAVDTSGNESAYDIIGPITTLPDTRSPGDPTRLRLFSGSSQISLAFDPSPTSDITKYIITLQPLSPSGVPTSTSELDNGLSETAQLTGLTNGIIYRVTVQAVRMPGTTEIRSTGIVSEIAPSSRSGPLSVTSLTAAPGVGTISLSWAASTSPSGAAAGQKAQYFIRVASLGGPDSAPISAGLSTSKTLNSFNAVAAVGTGPIQFFEDDTVYLFKVSAVDSFGNESGFAVVKATTLDVTAPKNPRSFSVDAGDEYVDMTWRHGQSIDVVGYEIEIDTGSGFGAPIEIGYITSYRATGLTNGISTVFRIKAVDDAGNKSSGATSSATPIPDTIPPAIPSFVHASPGDEQVRLTWGDVDDEDFSHFIVQRQAIEQDLDVSPTQTLTVIPGTTTTFNVGTNTTLIDIGLINGQSYVYTVTSVDMSGNQSDPTGNVITAPSEGINTGADRMEAPDLLASSFSGSSIDLSWEYDYFGATLVGLEYVYTVNADAAPTAFNIYRSTDEFVGYQLIVSVPSRFWTYSDENLLNGVTYYYRIAAVRDTADLVTDTGSIEPPNSIFLGTVTASGGMVTSVDNEQRIAENLESTLTEETLSRLLVHRHTVKPLNNTTVTALGLISLIDINDLSLIDLSSLSNLSESARAYYETVDKDDNGNEITFDDNTIYIISPNNIVNNAPYIGDFQVLVNGDRPSDAFTIDEANNSVVFSSALSVTDEVSAAGLGLTYYVPGNLDSNPTGPEPEGFEVLVNGTVVPDAHVDETLQTIRFLVARSSNDEVAVEIDAVVPDFGTQEGARRVSLSPQIVLTDFERINSKTYRSTSGVFDASDNVIVLVNGTPTTLDHFIDFDNKQVVFTNAVPTSTQVSLDIRDREEVQGLLSPDRIVGLDGSQFKSGKFINPQLPDMHHTGRVQERAYPVFSPTSTSNGYVYQGEAGITGTARTAYAVAQVDDGDDIAFLMGTSGGLLRSSAGIFLGIEDVAEINGISINSESSPFDGPIKQFFQDSTGAILAVTRNSVYESSDGGFEYVKMKGLEAVGVVHRISELGGTLFAATDLGAYVIEPAIRDGSKWFQGGLIGAGTTEVFDLSPFDGEMLAATEIGLFASADGVIWVAMLSADDVFNVETFGNETIFVQVGQDLYRSDDAGANFSRTTTQAFFDHDSIMVARDPLDLLVGTPDGLFYSQDGIQFSLVDFDLNRDTRRNNVHMVDLVGGDAIVAYDNVVMSIGPGFETSIFEEFVGIIPTVRVNGSEVRSGFRYDTSAGAIIFELKRLSDDIVEVTSNYSLFELSGGGWYPQNPSAPVQVFVDKAEQASSSLLVDPRLGQISFITPRYKYEIVTISVAGTTLRNEGELFHEELEDRFEMEKGLPLSMGRNYSANLLQLGLSIEHNFLERGLERDQYYCLTGSFVDRSFNSFWSNAEFYILGRRDFDTFNSTIDYAVESEQQSVGPQALVPLSSLEVSSAALFVGTDNGIFILDPSSSFAISGTLSLDSNERVSVRDLGFFLGDIIASTSNGIYTISDTLEVSKNAGNNLPKSVFSTAVLNNRLVAGTRDTIYYTDSTTEPAYGTWFRSTFTELGSTAPIIVQGNATSLLVRDGIFFAAIGNALFTSTSGQQWERVFQFPSSQGIVVNRMASQAGMLFLGTNKGVYNDRGTAQSDLVSFELEPLEVDDDESASIHINDLYAGVEQLYAATDSTYLYIRQNEVWTKSVVPASSVHEIIETSGGNRVAMSNNQVFVE